MRFRFRLLLGVFAVLAPFAFAKDRVVTRDFQVGSDASLVVTTYRGGIVVRESEDPVIHVEATFSTLSEGDAHADERLNRENIQFAQNGSKVSIDLPNPSKSGVKFDWDDDKQVSVAIEVTVPRHCSVSATTTDGGITIGNLVGTMYARARTGTLFLKGIDGSIEARAETGDVIVSHATGSVNLRTDRGDIRAGPIEGKATLKTDFGSVLILQAKGGVDASAESGDINAGFPKGVTADAYLHADGGGITVWIAKDLPCTIDASSVWGHVEARVPLKPESGANGSSHLKGTVNGGGPKLVLRASGGHVRLLAGDTAAPR